MVDLASNGHKEEEILTSIDDSPSFVNPPPFMVIRFGINIWRISEYNYFHIF